MIATVRHPTRPRHPTRQRHPTRRRRRLGPAAVAICLLLLTTAAGCGIPRDSEPREVSVNGDLLGPTSTVPVASGNADVPVYFPVEDKRLERIIRKAEANTDATLALQLLLNGPRQEERELLQVSTSIPSGTKVLGTKQDGETLTIDLSRAIEDIQGRNLTTAYAQMVFTATAVETDPPIVRVKFTVEGEESQAPSDEGQRPFVEKKNYNGPNTPDG